MSLILNIDTSTELAFVCLSRHGELIDTTFSVQQKEHAVFLHSAIQEIFSKNQIAINQIDGIAVTEGPGSYTGLRVGMSTAKGLCYALRKPLITLSSLVVIANACKQIAEDVNAFYCPMIDARRMEVFTAIYNFELEEILQPKPVILDEDTFVETLLQKTIYFAGNGAKKFFSITEAEKAILMDVNPKNLATSMCHLSYKLLLANSFGDLVLSNPVYLKEYNAS